MLSTTTQLVCGMIAVIAIRSAGSKALADAEHFDDFGAMVGVWAGRLLGWGAVLALLAASSH